MLNASFDKCEASLSIIELPENHSLLNLPHDPTLVNMLNKKNVQQLYQQMKQREKMHQVSYLKVREIWLGKVAKLCTMVLELRTQNSEFYLT